MGCVAHCLGTVEKQHDAQACMSVDLGAFITAGQYEQFPHVEPLVHAA